MTKPIDRARLFALVRRFAGNEPQARVLIVDDDPEVRDIVRTTLESSGLKTFQAANGRAAIEWLERHPDVEQAIVVPAPDEIKYRIPYAFVVKRAGSTLSDEDVKQHALKNAPPYQYPRRVIFLPSMPMNGIGKIDRKGLAARAAALVEEKKATVRN